MRTKLETVNVGSNKKARVRLVALLIILVLLLNTLVGCTSTGGEVLTYNLSEPLGGATTAQLDIDPGDGNLTIDQLTGSEPVLASGTLEYLETQNPPSASVDMSSGQAALNLKASGGEQQPWFRFPWDACNGATTWQIHLNPGVQSDINAHTDGGNVTLNLSGLAVTHVSADTGGGNMDVVLPEKAANLSLTVKTGAGDVSVVFVSGITGSSTVNASSGAGNVVVRVPDGIAARIHATSGMGKVIVDSRFSKIDDTTYQSPDYDSAADKVEITLSSGAGNVSVNPQ